MAPSSRRHAKKTAPHAGRGSLLRRAAVALFLLALFAFVALAKVHVARSLDHFDPRDGTAFYWTEAAVQYRYARMVADGVPIPDPDVKLQHPEGVSPSRELLVLMESVAGHVHRALGRLVAGVPFHVYLIWLTGFYSTLSVPVAYGLALVLFRSHGAAACAALLYGLATPSAGRLVGSYNREDFALPFLFGGCWLFARALARGPEAMRRRLAAAIGAGLLFAVALAAWHFSRFVFLTFAISAGAALLAARREDLAVFSRSLLAVTAVVVAAGTLVPGLRAGRFFASPQVAFCLALGLAAAWDARGGAFPLRGRRLHVAGVVVPVDRALRLILLAIPLVALSLLLQTEAGGYGHVWSLFLAKIRHLGVKPVDPAELPFAARVLWVEAFQSPDLYYVLTSFWAVIPACLVFLFRRRRTDADPSDLPLVFVGALAWLFAGLFLFIQRLSVLAVFFLAAIGGGAVRGLSRRGAALAGAALLPVVLLLGHEFLHIGRTTPFRAAIRRILRHQEPVVVHNWQMNDVAVVRWIREHTPPDAVFLARFGVSPLVLAYADRATLLQPKFEAARIREKVQEFWAALYSTEEALAAFCERYGATHYLFDARSAIDDSTDSDRYGANALRLATTTPAFRMQFAPERLTRFRLVYVDSFYRIYQLVREPPANDPRDFTYQPLFDPARFGGQDGGEAFFDDAYTEGVVRALDEAVALFLRGRDLFNRGDYPAALRHLDEALARNPSLVGAHTYLGMSLAMLGRLPEALRETGIEARIAPDHALAWYNLGYVRYLARDYSGALAAWYECRRLDPDFAGLAEGIAKLERAAAAGPQ